MNDRQERRTGMSNSPVKFTVKNGFYYLTEGVLEYCIWNDYLEKNTAMISGMKIDTFGLLPVRYFKNRQASAPSWVGTWMVRCYFAAAATSASMSMMTVSLMVT